MKILYDPHTETLKVILIDNVAVYESNEDKPGVILDYDRKAILSHLKFPTTLKRVTDIAKVDFPTG